MRRLLSVGEVTVDDRLAIRGIFVGVSFDSADDVLLEDNGGPSFDDIWPTVPTEGDPAIVGNWCLLNEVSDCFCIELAV